jgi:hypothetical protein
MFSDILGQPQLLKIPLAATNNRMDFFIVFFPFWENLFLEYKSPSAVRTPTISSDILFNVPIQKSVLCQRAFPLSGFQQQGNCFPG